MSDAESYSLTLSFIELLLCEELITQANGSRTGFKASLWGLRVAAFSSAVGMYSVCSIYTDAFVAVGTPWSCCGVNKSFICGGIPQHINYALLVQWYIVYGHTIPKKSKTKFKEETWETGAGQRKEMKSTQDLGILAFEECWEQLRTEHLIWRRALSSGVSTSAKWNCAYVCSLLYEWWKIPSPSDGRH